MIRLLVVDDSKVDRAYFQALLSAGDPPWTRNVEFCMASGPPSDLSVYGQYHGVILDLHLGAVNGLDIARQIHEYDWRIPIMVMTGSDPSEIPLDTHDYVDCIAFKQAGAPDRMYDDLFGAVRCLLRQIGRIRAAFADGLLSEA